MAELQPFNTFELHTVLSIQGLQGKERERESEHKKKKINEQASRVGQTYMFQMDTHALSTLMTVRIENILNCRGKVKLI